MIFIGINTEKVVQLDDKTRIDAAGSYYSGDAITDVEIEPESGAGFFSVFNGGDRSKWFLDWSYETDGVKTATVRITDGVSTKTKTAMIIVLLEEEDNLFSNDQDILHIESELVKYLRPGRNSYLDKHRESQHRILQYLDAKRIWNDDGSRITKDQITDVEEVKMWSKYETLSMIFEDLKVQNGDKFEGKSLEYKKLRNEARNRAVLRFDEDKDGTIQNNENYDLKSFFFVRR